VAASVAEVEIDDQDSGGGHDLGDQGVAAPGADNDVAPPVGRTKK